MVPLGAYLAFRQQRARRPEIGYGAAAFVRYCVPRSIFTNPSCRLDVLFVVVKHFVNHWLLLPLLLGSTLTANVAYRLLVAGFGERISHTPGVPLTVALLAVCVLAQDFVQFLFHYLLHKVRLLWYVHQVHHSSEFLLFSFSVKRTHFLEEVFNLSLTSGVIGLLIGAMSFTFAIPIWKSELFGVDAWFLVHLFSFWHLPHSHMGLSYGWLESILQSPAQHQLRHSVENEHWDKNFGLLFSFWDRLFGCFLRSLPPENFRLGLPQADRGDYDSVLKLFFMPFWKIGKAVLNDRGGQLPGVSIR